MIHQKNIKIKTHNIQRFIFIFLFGMLSISNVNAATIKGTILDKAAKPFAIATITSMAINQDGEVESEFFAVGAKGNYNIKLNNTGYYRLVIGVDSMDKMTIHLFVDKNKNYDLKIKMPHTKYPYVNFRDVDFSSKDKTFAENIVALLNVQDMNSAVAVRFNTYIKATQKDSSKYLNNAKTLLDSMVNYYFQTKDNGTKFIIGINYLNLIDSIYKTGNITWVSNELVKDFISKYNYSTSYYHTCPINFDNLANYFSDGYFNEYFGNFVTKSNNDFIRADILSQAVAYYYDAKDDRKNSAIFYKKLEELFPESEPFIFVRLKYDPDKKIQVEHQLPEFSFKSPEEEIVYDNKFFNGKFLLLYFWNTTSEGIDVQISTLTTAFSNFFDDNFEILSVSFDESWQNVVEYRLKRYPMRWHHSFEEYSFNSGAIKTFEIYKIPYLILVSPDGKILALNDSLQGNKLIPTLTKFIKK
jgi:hypothetical protein